MIYFYRKENKLVTAWKPLEGLTPLNITEKEAQSILGFSKDGSPIQRQKVLK